MKVVKIAYTILSLSLVIVVINCFILGKIITNVTDMVEKVQVEDCEELKEELERIYAFFKKRESYIALTVSHDDLTNIEDAFAEMIGAAEAADTDSVTIAKSRLLDALGHLKRLSGLNIDSIL